MIRITSNCSRRPSSLLITRLSSSMTEAFSSSHSVLLQAIQSWHLSIFFFFFISKITEAMDNNNHLHGLNFIFISLNFIFVDIFLRVFNIVFALKINFKIASKADKDKIIMLKFIVISILRVNWLFGSNSSYIKHRTQQYMYNNIDQYNLKKKFAVRSINWSVKAPFISYWF